MPAQLELLKQIAHGLAAQCGPNTEVVIHDLTDRERDPVVAYIENGHVTHRSAGDGPSPVGIAARKKTRSQLPDKLGFTTRTADGKVLKSSTLYIWGTDDQLDYILSLNTDVTVLMAAENAIHALISPDAEQQPAVDRPATNVNELLDSLIQQSVALVGKPVPLMTKEDKVKAIRFLNDSGALLITKSGAKISQFFGISKYTLYSYIEEGSDQ
ncbi:MAG: helix-turn-helix transcriptional regulator [Clostridiales bacterium]|nr:helix-turn-helix transcriptional regulator [Clostridiales bacterium]